MSARPDHLDAVRIPSGENAGRPLQGLAETERGQTWLRWALRWPGWEPDFREALEAYVRTKAPLVWRRWCRERRGAR